MATQTSRNTSKRKKAARRRIPKPVERPSIGRLKELADMTKKNMEAAITELKNELKRMAGKVVDADHQWPLSGDSSATSTGEQYVDYYRRYTITPEQVRKELDDGSCDSDSDEMSDASFDGDDTVRVIVPSILSKDDAVALYGSEDDKIIL